jgi:hypothetical protein
LASIPFLFTNFTPPIMHIANFHPSLSPSLLCWVYTFWILVQDITFNNNISVLKKTKFLYKVFTNLHYKIWFFNTIHTLCWQVQLFIACVCRAYGYLSHIHPRPFPIRFSCFGVSERRYTRVVIQTWNRQQPESIQKAAKAVLSENIKDSATTDRWAECSE